MHYAREFTMLIVVAVLLLGLLATIGYSFRSETPGEDAPPKHRIGAEPPHPRER